MQEYESMSIQSTEIPISAVPIFSNRRAKKSIEAIGNQQSTIHKSFQPRQEDRLTLTRCKGMLLAPFATISMGKQK
jgi:hypothetical protein